MSVVNEIAHLLNVGLILPVRIATAQPSFAADYNMLIAHGLGSENPKDKNHLKDRWVDLIGEGSMLTKRNVTNVSYTARGHGNCHGWEDSAESNPLQFTWRFLSNDMLALADHYSLQNVVTSGSSMGAATSLFAAFAHPDRVRGVIMVRPPTAWKERRARKKYLLGSAAKCRDLEFPGEKYHFVLQGAALADLPDIESEIEMYRKVRCPVLILTVEGDPAHPVSTATALENVLPNSELHIAADTKSAFREWPQIIAAFILSLPAMPVI